MWDVGPPDRQTNNQITPHPNQAAPGAIDSLKGFAQGLKSNLEGLKDGASSLADGAGKATSLPSLPKLNLDLKSLPLPDVGDLPLSNELKAKLAEIQEGVGGAVGSKISEFSGAVGERVGEALTPYQPLIDQTTAQLGDKLSVVKKLADQVGKEVSKDAEPALGVLKSLGPRGLFNVENAVALPFWLTLILAPNNGLVKGLVSPLAGGGEG